MFRKTSIVVISSLSFSGAIYADNSVENNHDANTPPVNINNIMQQPNQNINASEAEGAKAPFGLVLGLQGGYGKIKDISHTDLDNVKNGNIFGGGIIGFDFALNHMISFGAESGYDYGYHILDGNNTKLDYQMIPILGAIKFTLPFGLQIFGKGGMAYVTEDLNVDGTGLSATSNAWKPMAAVGVAYIYENWSLFAQYQYVFGDDEVQNKDEVSKFNAITAGVTYTFPISF